ncbi:MAG TPA: DUF4442 domain-containing protein [Gammaproteobacteria bacterium]|nr:DUF4442 domain-containing protein [Gammaproteobacteria bacterium]
MSTTQWSKTLNLWVFTFIKIPLIMWLRPRVIVQDGQKCTVMIKLCRRSKNHVGSMYFGALCTGADLTPGLIAIDEIKKQKAKCSFVFKDFNANFLKRCMSDVYFTCDEGLVIADAVRAAVKTGERQNVTLTVIATTPDITGAEPMALFKLTLSIKNRNSESRRK